MVFSEPAIARDEQTHHDRNVERRNARLPVCALIFLAAGALFMGLFSRPGFAAEISKKRAAAATHGALTLPEHIDSGSVDPILAGLSDGELPHLLFEKLQSLADPQAQKAAEPESGDIAGIVNQTRTPVNRRQKRNEFLRPGATNRPQDIPNVHQSFSEQLTLFFNNLIKVPKDVCLKVFGRYSRIIASEIRLDNLYYGSYKEVENLLDHAANGSMDALTLFTHPLLQDRQGVAVVFCQELLQQINQKFDFHGLFCISVPSAKDGSAVIMKYFVIGQGKLIVGYNRNATIKHPDYDFVTGKYDYCELFIMETRNDAAGNPGLFNIKGISTPEKKLRWMQGPLNVDIYSLTVTSDADGRPKIRVEFGLIGTMSKLLDPIPIEKLTEPYFKRLDF